MPISGEVAERKPTLKLSVMHTKLAAQFNVEICPDTEPGKAPYRLDTQYGAFLIQGKSHCRELLLSRLCSEMRGRRELNGPGKLNLLGFPQKKSSNRITAQFIDGAYQYYPKVKDLGRELTHAADIICGNTLLLLNTHRLAGEGQYQPRDRAVWEDGYNFHYYGIDSVALWHPALAAIALGLLRQTFDLVESGLLPKVLECVSRESIEEGFRTGEYSKLRANLRAALPYILVKRQPEPKDQAFRNDTRFMRALQTRYPFPAGYYKRLYNLVEACQRHGMEAVFGASPTQNWDNWTNGIWSWLGYSTEATPTQLENRKKIAKLARE